MIPFHAAVSFLVLATWNYLCIASANGYFIICTSCVPVDYAWLPCYPCYTFLQAAASRACVCFEMAQMGDGYITVGVCGIVFQDYMHRPSPRNSRQRPLSPSSLKLSKRQLFGTRRPQDSEEGASIRLFAMDVATLII